MSYLGHQLTLGSIKSEFFSGDGTTTTFDLAYDYGTEPSVLVFISGVRQQSDTYTLYGGVKRIEFTSPPGTGINNIEIVYLVGSVVYDGLSRTSPTGAGTYKIFYENGKTVTASYSITRDSNAMTTGPITVNSGVTVTVPTGSRWVVL